MAANDKEVLMKADHVKVYFKGKKKGQTVKAVDDVSFEIMKGETFGVVGESGCGKSTLGRTLIRLQQPTDGHIYLNGTDIAGLKGAQLKEMRKEAQIIFQDPSACLNPRRTIKQILMEPFEIHNLKGKIDVDAKIMELLQLVGLDSYHLSRYPHELSGGQKQRIGIARALALEPQIIICDEAVSALDVSVQAQVLNLLQELKEKLGLTYFFISHNLNVVYQVSDRVGVVIMLFGVATLVFILTKLVPGDPVTANLSQRALGDPQIVAAYKAKYGLDQPIIVQYVYYMKNLLHFDLGTSIRTNNAVLSELARCYPATIELAVFAIILATLFGILFGVISAIKRNSILDQIVRAISVTGVSLPSFWFALLVLYFFYYKLQILPGPGRLGNAFSAPQTVTGFFVIDSLLEGDIPKALDALRHLILPGTVLAAFTMGLITRTTRSNLLDVMSTDYIRTARAKGLSNVRLIIHHALGNALIPVLTVIGLGFGNLLGGMVLVETIFNWPGVGQFAYQSVLSNDYPSIIGVALLIALNYMIINTVVDILYGIIDPRVRCS